MKYALALSTLCLSLAACSPGPRPAMGGGTPRPGTAPITNAAGSSQGMPQSPNSLPPGDRVNAPVVAPTGVIESTRVR